MSNQSFDPNNALDGWDGLNKYMGGDAVNALKQQYQSQSPGQSPVQSRDPGVERKQLAFYSLFHSELGQFVLECMRQHSIEKTCMPAQAPDGVAVFAEVMRREGENEHYRWIKTMIQKGEQLSYASQPQQTHLPITG